MQNHPAAFHLSDKGCSSPPPLTLSPSLPHQSPQTSPQTADTLLTFTHDFRTPSVICLKVTFSVKPSLPPHVPSQSILPKHSQTHPSPLPSHFSLSPFPLFILSIISTTFSQTISSLYFVKCVSPSATSPGCTDGNINSRRAGI